MSVHTSRPTAGFGRGKLAFCKSSGAAKVGWCGYRFKSQVGQTRIGVHGPNLHADPCLPDLLLKPVATPPNLCPEPVARCTCAGRARHGHYRTDR
eukprot:1196208-Prorocentrum_minimum.AAC.5